MAFNPEQLWANLDVENRIKKAEWCGMRQCDLFLYLKRL